MDPLPRTGFEWLDLRGGHATVGNPSQDDLLLEPMDDSEFMGLVLVAGSDFEGHRAQVVKG